MKIFELAKEYDMSSLDLVEKLKSNGFNVRNHMTKLTDDDVVKVKELLAAKAEPEEAPKKKKKAVKKKTAKKKAASTGTKKAGAAKKTKKTAKDSGDKAKKVTVRKRTVIRKKAGAAEEVEEKPTVEATPAVDTSTPEEQPKAEAKPEATEESEGQGLQIVSRPEAKKEAPKKDEKSEADEKEYFKEKVHRFTPVYIPTEEELAKQKAEAKKEEKAQEAQSEDPNKVPDEDGGPGKRKDEASTKKRLGGLASMMSGKKPTVNRSQMLNEERTENELKSYAALSSLGRPIYSQVKKKKLYSGPSDSTEITEVKESKRVVTIHKSVTASDLAQKLSQKFENFSDQCLDINLLVKPTDHIGLILASKIAAMYGYRVEDKAFNEDKVIGKKSLSDDEKSKLPLRNPIITIMGHVDHGKTTLLDYIRESKVVDGEAGGITQHIGAYSVQTKNKKTLTFLDTPGHAAFASMRQRGADVTDIVILVVAADDGVMPQTRESIKFCKNAGVPIIVAVNKMDKEGANPDRVKQALTEFELTPEEWGGDTQFSHISASKGDGVDDLLEAVALQAEMMELRAEPKGKAEGVVIESRIEAGRGPVATILVQSGTLKKGESMVVGECYGRARSLTDHTGKQLNTAGPSTPVQILGLNQAPSPGDIFNIVKNEREAKKIVSNRVDERKVSAAAPEKKKVSLEDFFGAAVEGEKKELNLIVRSDVNGSYEAIVQSLEALSNNEVTVKVIGGGVGAINDNDVRLAEGASAFIFGFNMRPINTARRLAEQLGVDVKTYSIIYELINDVKLAIEGLLEPEFVEEFIGRAEVRETFSVPKVGVIAGSYVIDGKIQVGCGIRLLRSGKIIHDGKLSSLKRFKDDVKEVKQSLECGIGLENFNDVKIGDVFEAYMMIERKRTYDEVSSEESAESTSHAGM